MCADPRIAESLVTIADDEIQRLKTEVAQLREALYSHIHATPWENDREKRLAEIAIKLEMRMRQAKAYSFITEAWSATAPKDWDPDTPIPEKERPMHRVDRQEVVIAFATDGDRCEWRRWIIHRDWNEQIITLEAANDWAGKPEGWMAEMLTKTK